MINKQTTTMKVTISKVRNFQGYWFTCNCCGRDIKHAYTSNNTKGHYGSECIYKVSGLTYEGSQKQIRELKFRDKKISEILASKKAHNWEEYKKAYGYNEDEMINHFLRKGTLS